MCVYCCCLQATLVLISSCWSELLAPWVGMVCARGFAESLHAEQRADCVLRRAVVWCGGCVQALLGEGAEGAAEDDEEAEEEEEINLHAAASDGNAEQLKQLLEDADCDVNQADEEGRTALHFAGGSRRCALAFPALPAAQQRLVAQGCHQHSNAV